MNSSLAKEMELLAEIAEIKRIYSAIETSLLKSTPGCLVVTSSVPGEGKTIMVGGLAAIAARQGDKRVLAVDLNWYAPALHTYFGLDLKFDVDTLMRGKSIVDLVQSTGLNNLDILAATQATQNEPESAGNLHVHGTEIMRQACEAYDFVVVDTSAIFPTNRRMMDPVTFSKDADGVALVVSTNTTPRPQVRRARIALETAGANVLGVIVNQWKNPIV